MTLTTDTANRLRISVAVSDAEVESARRAVRDGRDMLAREGEAKPDLERVVWRLMQDAARTEGSLNDRERAWLAAHGRSAWPELARPSEECRQVEWEQELGFIQGTMVQERTPMPRLDIYKANHERMLTVLGWLKHMKAKSFDRFIRDRSIVLDLARGVPHRLVRVRYFRRDSSDAAVQWVKYKMLRDVTGYLNQILTKSSIDCKSRAS